MHTKLRQFTTLPFGVNEADARFTCFDTNLVACAMHMLPFMYSTRFKLSGALGTPVANSPNESVVLDTSTPFVQARQSFDIRKMPWLMN